MMLVLTVLVQIRL